MTCLNHTAKCQSGDLHSNVGFQVSALATATLSPV